MIMYHYKNKWLGRIDHETGSPVEEINISISREKRDFVSEGQINEGRKVDE